jgi:hypothetical protein
MTATSALLPAFPSARLRVVHHRQYRPGRNHNELGNARRHDMIAHSRPHARGIANLNRSFNSAGVPNGDPADLAAPGSFLIPPLQVSQQVSTISPVV